MKPCYVDFCALWIVLGFFNGKREVQLVSYHQYILSLTHNFASWQKCTPRNVHFLVYSLSNQQWSNVLANGANTWVNECKKGNDRFLNKEKSDMKDLFKRLGQNHWAGFEEVLYMKNVVNSWGVEVENYSFEKRRCVSESGSAPNCGHYTQVNQIPGYKAFFKNW